MRVTITTVEDFCAELSREARADCVWRKQVRTRIDRAPEQDEQITFTIAIWATAVIKSPEGDYLMEYGEICGSDDVQAEPADAATQQARAKVAMIQAVAKEAGLLCLPGKFEAV